MRAGPQTGTTLRLAATAVAVALLAACSSAPPPLTVFYAPAFEPVFHDQGTQLAEALGRPLRTETAASQTTLRKITELGRACDLVLLADSELFAQLGGPAFTWRIDFASDEMVLGVGIRAPRTDDAERDWPAVLLDPSVRIGRVDERLAPVGYRTLILWRLQESFGPPGLDERLEEKGGPVVSDLGKLAALLKAGDVDYAFLYRTACIMHDIRYIALPPAINMGSADVDYSHASVAFSIGEGTARSEVTMRGGPIVYGLSIPAQATHALDAALLIELLLTDAQAWQRDGFTHFTPRFFGPTNEYPRFASVARYGGPYR